MKISILKLKISVLKLVIGLTIYLTPTIPMYFFEPIHKGTDPNVYSHNYDTYALCLCTLLFLSWAYVSSTISNYIVKKISKDWQEESQSNEAN